MFAALEEITVSLVSYSPLSDMPIYFTIQNSDTLHIPRMQVNVSVEAQ